MRHYSLPATRRWSSWEQNISLHPHFFPFPFFLCPTPATVVIMIVITTDVRHPPLCVAFSARLLDQRQGPLLISIWTSEEMWSRGVPRHRGTIVPVPSILPYIYISHPWLGHMPLLDVCSSNPLAEVVLKCMVRVRLPFFNRRVKLKWFQKAKITMGNQVECLEVSITYNFQYRHTHTFSSFLCQLYFIIHVLKRLCVWHLSSLFSI